MIKIKDWFKSKSAEQIFSLCLLLTCVFVMLFCAIVRLCGGLWFTADLDSVPIPNEFWQQFIKGCLLVFELTFTYKILCRTSWFMCICIGIIQTVIIAFIPDSNNTISNIINLVMILAIPICFTRKFSTIIDSVILYAMMLLYGLTFLIGRVGYINENAAYDFVTSVITTIDYKLFIVCIYLVQNYFGGIKLWKTQRRLIFQKDLNAKGI